ncbi:MAG: J domain-containing protein [Sedimenticola sp.]
MQDPYLILNVPRVTTDEQVRQAYLAAIRHCPPDRDAAQFQSIQQAYEAIKCQRSRLRNSLFNIAMPAPDDLFIQALTQLDPAPPRPGIKLFQGVIKNGFKAI